jgi:transcriptional regulator with XRE-family HTH domain
MDCTSCGQMMILCDYEHVTVVDGVRFVDSAYSSFRCKACGCVELTGKQLSTYELRVARELLRRCAMTGERFKFARKALGLTAAQLALVLEFSAATVLDMERGDAGVNAALRMAMLWLIECNLGDVPKPTLPRDDPSEVRMPPEGSLLHWYKSMSRQERPLTDERPPLSVGEWVTMLGSIGRVTAVGDGLVRLQLYDLVVDPDGRGSTWRRSGGYVFGTSEAGTHVFPSAAEAAARVTTGRHPVEE